MAAGMAAFEQRMPKNVAVSTKILSSSTVLNIDYSAVK